MLPQFEIPFDPVADPLAVVIAEQARFTMLSERLIRMEYSPSGEFEDHASQAFWYRRQPVPPFELLRSSNRLEIDTTYLHLTYQISTQGFTPDNIRVLVKSTGQTWQYGDWPGRGGNLHGTARTLDQASGEVRLEPGLVGRAGWAVVDDSRSLVFGQTGWIEPRQRPENQDLYFFGYGHDYPACLREFSLVAGNTPLIPRWILGNWWSRYWAYSQEELLALMQEFRDHQVPLAVCIVDMDWHITTTGNRSSGWTGFTWNRKLFPDPDGFIAALHNLGLKTALNLHPADGVYPHEAQYDRFAELMGLSPDGGQPIPFDSADPKFIQGYFDMLLHPYEGAGVDFWWLDWQQGTRSRLPGLDPLWWMNHLHFYELGRDSRQRPFIFSRWGGLGNHRYPIGFSGDTIIGWEALSNLPGFTATAANVGYGWWSHDIGGHWGGIEDDELYVRWVQYGVFSPVLRLHSTNNPYHERRPWSRGAGAGQVAIAAMRLRHTLIPYIYSMAWRNYTTSLPLITPLYYSHPEAPEAYQVKQEYWFGSELIAAPFTAPANPETGLTRQTVWLPQGDWFDFFSGERLTGGGWRALYGALEDIPVFSRPGAILPLSQETTWGRLENPADLQVVIFPGAENRFELVEDDGQSTGYLRGVYAVTAISLAWRDQAATVTISPVRGDLTVIPEGRRFQLLLRGFAIPAGVVTRLNDQEVLLGYEYDPSTETLKFEPLGLKPTDELKLEIQATGPSLYGKRDRSAEKLHKYLRAFHLLSSVKQAIDKDWPEIAAGRKSLRSYAGLSDAQLVVLENILLE